MVAGLDAVPLCTTPTPPPSSAAWPLGAAAQAAALHSKPRGVAQATPHRGMAAAAVIEAGEDVDREEFDAYHSMVSFSVGHYATDDEVAGYHHASWLKRH